MGDNKVQDELENQAVMEEVAAEAAESGNQEVVDETLTQIAALKIALEKAEAKATENYELALRTKAEMENSKRRMDKDLSNAHKFAIEKFAMELLPVIDSLEMGLLAAQDKTATIEKFREGSEMTLKMFLSALEKSGVEVVNPEGQKFNPELHQAMTMQENNDVEPNTVLTVVQKGFVLNGRIMRPAMVIVSKAASAPKSGQIDETV